MELNGTKPIYIQIKEYYENLIESGLLKEGDEMPSVREIAIAHGINPNTVQRALSLMVDDGYLQNIPKKGFFVKRVNKNKTQIIRKAIDNLYASGIKKEEIIEYLNKEENNK